MTASARRSIRVDLCSFGPPPGAWPHGAVTVVAPNVRDVADVMAKQAGGDADATLFWDPRLGAPQIEGRWLHSRADVVHAGLRLGTSGSPTSIDFVTPTWMWSTDPPADIEATSWRISWRACLIRHEVLRQLGIIRVEFQGLDAAALELGHRYLTRGAFVRHDPSLAPGAEPRPLDISLHDDLLFSVFRHGRFWANWALGRGLLTRAYAAASVRAALPALAVTPPSVPAFVRVRSEVAIDRAARVTVILPTIERYPYLRQLLPQLAAQTHPVHEIIIVDQTPIEAREPDLANEFPTLPIRTLYQDVPGQCTARNAALHAATGDFALFIDDDDEVQPDLVYRHLQTLTAFGVDISCGVAEEVGAGPIPEYQRFLRQSDVFPTNNSMIRRSVLARSGMFDLAYDRKICEDGDLGMRMYLAGEWMILDPSISVLHHHAPRGGLRTHGARATTYASSRKKIAHRNIPHVSEVYLGMRYFSDRQVREMLVLRSWGTLRAKGGYLLQAAKGAYGLAALPSTFRRVRSARVGATELLRSNPQIATLDDAEPQRKDGEPTESARRSK